MMPAPTPLAYQRPIGRFGEFTLQAVWTNAEADDFEDVKVLDIEVLSGKYNDSRFAVTSIRWASEGLLSADVEFDSVPRSAEGIVLNITPDASSGAIDFRDYPNGCKSEPNRDGPGNLVVTTRGALAGSELFLSGTYMEKGTKNPGAA